MADGLDDGEAELSTVTDYITDIRTMLQDEVQPYRYDDTSLTRAFNMALLEGRRLRPDLFYTKHGIRVPHYDSPSDTPVPLENQFRLAFVFGAASHALLRDQEDVQDQRSNTFLMHFRSLLTGEQPAAIQGGTPGPGSAQK